MNTMNSPPVTPQGEETKRYREALESIAEGNLGDQPWQANYERIREIATQALSTPPSLPIAPDHVLVPENLRALAAELEKRAFDPDMRRAGRAFVDFAEASARWVQSLLSAAPQPPSPVPARIWNDKTKTFDHPPSPGQGSDYLLPDKAGVVEIIDRLRERYTAQPVPPCRVCGRPLRIQRAGGGEATTWGCDGLESDPDNPGRLRQIEGRGIADSHYSQSLWTQLRPGDDDVIALLDHVAALSPPPVVEEAGLVELYRDIFAEITAKALPLCEDAAEPEKITGYRLPVGPLHRAAGKVNFQMFNGEKHLAAAVAEVGRLRRQAVTGPRPLIVAPTPTAGEEP